MQWSRAWTCGSGAAGGVDDGMGGLYGQRSSEAHAGASSFIKDATEFEQGTSRFLALGKQVR